MESHKGSGRFGFFIDATDPVGRPAGPALLVLVPHGVVHPVRLLGLGDDVIDVGPFAVPLSIESSLIPVNLVNLIY